MARLIPGKRPKSLGVKSGGLGGSGRKPNCVSTQSSRENFKVEPLAYEGEASAAIKKLAGIIKAMPRTEIVVQTKEYLYAEFETRLLGFVDDVEFYAADGQIQMRSASRVGYSDWGVNRKRIAAIVDAYNN